ncbi:uncharacterized protein MYCFIDRAFT_175085 [Pseudocercospora fijiensis CIRAD86]|uniref:Uncharacterized protein n=1 Tax=Pseudocercospora fijiensis (strain CIRAD86) TaxID=383855 RepID=M3B2R7_PSEFD|nr:uncharacterized protein MYCFIDRAFT_175085 [Pseudocercospora fijiensis CIRAD86]EME83658.1 hypothetical protein MYCFIDRAFT_175085 [Pseudocercospora fijiensis CIRAD86]
MLLYTRVFYHSASMISLGSKGNDLEPASLGEDVGHLSTAIQSLHLDGIESVFTQKRTCLLLSCVSSVKDSDLDDEDVRVLSTEKTEPDGIESVFTQKQRNLLLSSLKNRSHILPRFHRSPLNTTESKPYLSDHSCTWPPRERAPMKLLLPLLVPFLPGVAATPMPLVMLLDWKAKHVSETRFYREVNLCIPFTTLPSEASEPAQEASREVAKIDAHVGGMAMVWMRERNGSSTYHVGRYIGILESEDERNASTGMKVKFAEQDEAGDRKWAKSRALACSFFNNITTIHTIPSNTQIDASSVHRRSVTLKAPSQHLNSKQYRCRVFPWSLLNRHSTQVPAHYNSQLVSITDGYNEQVIDGRSINNAWLHHSGVSQHAGCSSLRPRYGYSAIKANGGLIKFAPNRLAAFSTAKERRFTLNKLQSARDCQQPPQNLASDAGDQDSSPATQDGSVGEDIQGHLCQIVNGKRAKGQPPPAQRLAVSCTHLKVPRILVYCVGRQLEGQVSTHFRRSCHTLDHCADDGWLAGANIHCHIAPDHRSLRKVTVRVMDMLFKTQHERPSLLIFPSPAFTLIRTVFVQQLAARLRSRELKEFFQHATPTGVTHFRRSSAPWGSPSIVIVQSDPMRSNPAFLSLAPQRHEQQTALRPGNSIGSQSYDANILACTDKIVPAPLTILPGYAHGASDVSSLVTRGAEVTTQRVDYEEGKGEGELPQLRLHNVASPSFFRLLNTHASSHDKFPLSSVYSTTTGIQGKQTAEIWRCAV